MKALKIMKSRSIQPIDESLAELIRLSETAEVAAVVCLEETTSRGFHTAFRDGRAAQYDPAEGRFI